MIAPKWTAKEDGMKIRIIMAVPVNPAYGLTVGSEHEARPNQTKTEPRYWVDVKHGNTAVPVGVMSYEAEEITE